MSIRDQEALQYHSIEPAGKVSVVPTKPCRTQRDLSLAYTPGVAVPCQLPNTGRNSSACREPMVR